jgi:hypothetical protein
VVREGGAVRTRAGRAGTDPLEQVSNAKSVQAAGIEAGARGRHMPVILAFVERGELASVARRRYASLDGHESQGGA